MPENNFTVGENLLKASFDFSTFLLKFPDLSMQRLSQGSKSQLSGLAASLLCFATDFNASFQFAHLQAEFVST